ncbi:hypothetical protein GW916_14390 [bacterium]|nr:hypothetical protein [bacterium]
MVFFDDSRPEFTANSDFPLNGENSLSYWPEKNAPGYWLALDVNNDGMINASNELFGNNKDTTSNGFKALAIHDSNGDGVIDFKDPVFKNLVLWKDKNADGISQASELQPLSEKSIQYISLRYDDTQIDRVAARAQLRERALFTFKDQSGQTKAGEIVDVWVSPYFEDQGFSLVGN